MLSAKAVTSVQSILEHEAGLAMVKWSKLIANHLFYAFTSFIVILTMMESYPRFPL